MTTAELLKTHYQIVNSPKLLQAAQIIIQATSGTEKWWRIEKYITFTANAWTSRW
jgi:hypothetical protein